MSASKGIDIGTRRQSIAKLTRSPLASYDSSPLIANSPTRYGSVSNSLNQNSTFMKSQFKSDEALASSSASSHIDSFSQLEEEAIDFTSGIDDPKVMNEFNKHLGSDSSLQHEGGDITRDLYKLGKDQKQIRRSRSFSGTELEGGSRRGSIASSLNVPGGFRRDFIIQNKGKFQTRQPNFLAKNFIEFLSIYGHFAGEDLEDDDGIACHYKIDQKEGIIPIYKNVHGTASDRKAYFLLVKAFVGTGVLFLPKAFSNGGLLFSALLLLFFGILSYWCYLILVFAKTATNVSSFADIGLKLYGKWFQRLILFSIVISQIGFVAAYIVFTSENVKSFVANVFNRTDISISWYIFGELAILLPLSLIRDITKLSLLALLANIFISGGLLAIIYYMVRDLVERNAVGNNIEYLFNKSLFSLFIGIAIFAFEGIGLIIPIQESMINPDHFPKVLFKVIVTISSVFIAVGSLGYLTYGSSIETMVIVNLPQNIVVVLIQIFYAIAILLSTPIQLFPAIRLLESKIFVKTGKHSLRVKWSKNIFRFGFVIFTCLIALIGGQNLDKFVSFVGCFACIPLVYMYPPILHLKSCCEYDETLSTDENNKRFWLGLADYALVLIGGIALIYTTYNILFE